ncbi:hypothetical protein PT283_04780 [Acetobacteraceae bacterium ESL0697]|nr:hypothetical protein [Acetobacteraceae bacterium ESL0697]
MSVHVMLSAHKEGASLRACLDVDSLYCLLFSNRRDLPNKGGYL